MADDSGKVQRDRVFGLIRASGAQMIDVKFCGTLGHWHHVTMPSEQFTDKVFQEGLLFEVGDALGPAEPRDLLLFPDPETPFLDPFSQVTTLSIVADLHDPQTNGPSRLDTRAVARRAREHVRSSDLADSLTMSADLEFYIFDYVRYRNLPSASGYIVDSAEGEWNTYRPPGDGYQPAHVNPSGGGGHAFPPRDGLHATRNEIAVRLKEAGLGVHYHHHDAGGPGQCEISLYPGNILETADSVLKAKYFTKMVALGQNRIASFMPKPVIGDAGSGMHIHQHLTRGGKSLFFDSEDPAGLSATARHYVAGLLAHGPALSALTNGSTNSYKRLASLSHGPTPEGLPRTINLPSTASPETDRHVESLLPDAASNVYLALAGLAMAGLDGVRRELDPAATWPELPRDLEEALSALESDHAFLLEGDVFTEALLSEWTRRKRDEEIRELRLRPHPYEFHLYLDL